MSSTSPTSPTQSATTSPTQSTQLTVLSLSNSHHFLSIKLTTKIYFGTHKSNLLLMAKDCSVMSTTLHVQRMPTRAPIGNVKMLYFEVSLSHRYQKKYFLWWSARKPVTQSGPRCQAPFPPHQNLDSCLFACHCKKSNREKMNRCLPSFKAPKLLHLN